MYNAKTDVKTQRKIREALKWLYSQIPETKGCMECINKPFKEGGCGAWCCLLPETLIYTSSGPVAIKDIQTGMQVMTKGGWKKVLRIGSRFVQEQIIRLTTCYGRQIGLTSNHEVYAELIGRRERHTIGEPNFIEAGNLIAKSGNEEGHFVIFPKADWRHDTGNNFFILDVLDYVPHAFSIKTGDDEFVFASKRMQGVGIPRYLLMDEKWCRIIGLFLAEGSFDDSQINFHFDSEETDLHQEVFDFAAKLGLRCNGRITRGRSYTMRIFSRVLHSLFKTICGSGCDNKRVDSTFFSMTLSHKTLTTALHDGYYAGDGCTSCLANEAKYSLSTTSPELAAQLVYINHALDRIVGVYSVRQEHRRPSWHISEDRNAKYKDYIETDKDFRIPIRKIEKEWYEGLVFDIEVEDEHSFMTEAGEVHNCEIQVPQVLYCEFLNTWNYVIHNWTNEQVVALIGKCLRSYLFPKKDKSCVFWDRDTKLCTQHETRPYNCRVYGITPEEEFKPRYERLKVIYPDIRPQCDKVSTVSGKAVTMDDTNRWWGQLNGIEVQMGVSPKLVTDEPEGSYRTYLDHILLHLLGEEGLKSLFRVRQEGNLINKENTYRDIMIAVENFRFKNEH